nr:MAG TPA: hypothetical protein [Caudoviricetes sp.]
MNLSEIAPWLSAGAGCITVLTTLWANVQRRRTAPRPKIDAEIVSISVYHWFKMPEGVTHMPLDTPGMETKAVVTMRFTNVGTGSAFNVRADATSHGKRSTRTTPQRMAKMDVGDHFDLQFPVICINSIQHGFEYSDREWVGGIDWLDTKIDVTWIQQSNPRRGQGFSPDPSLVSIRPRNERESRRLPEADPIGAAFPAWYQRGQEQQLQAPEEP